MPDAAAPVEWTPIDRTDLVVDVVLGGVVELTLYAAVGGDGATLSGSANVEPLDLSLDRLLGDEGLGKLADAKGADERPLARLRNLVGTAAADQLAAVRLAQVELRYRRGKPSFVELSVEVAVGSSRLRFAGLKRFDADGGWIVGLGLHSGPKAPDSQRNDLAGLIGSISIDHLGLYHSSTAQDGLPFDPQQGLVAVDGLLPPQEPPARHFDEGFNFSARIGIGGTTVLDTAAVEAARAGASSADGLQGLAKTSDATQPGASPSAATASAAAEPRTSVPAAKPASAGSVAWFKIGKTLGPLTLSRVGMGIDGSTLVLKIDAGMKICSLTFTLEGLGVGCPLASLMGGSSGAGSNEPGSPEHGPNDHFWKHLEFRLDGAGVAFDGGAVKVAGGLVRTPNPEGLQLDGTLVISTAALTLSAIASYANLHGTPSFFAFVALHKEIGGPPFFFVTGLSFGLGINRRLQLPPIESVHRFPLLRAAMDRNYPFESKDLPPGVSPLAAMSAELAAHIAPSVGDMWVAAGVKFRSFGLIETVALLSVAFGTRTEIGLLGLSRLQVPPSAPNETTSSPIVYAELALKAAIDPDHGVLSVEARLTESSYILRKEFKLRGGFAFYSWFGPEHAGDFVVSLGGYHPRFTPPTHYPRPELISFSSRIGDVAISGSCYFALCPAAIMAGGRLSIVYESGGIRAWLDAHADLLLQWKPLHYDVAIGVSVGVAVNVKVWFVRIHLSVELSASLNLYGPPLGGSVRVSLWVVSFTVHFGEANAPPPPLIWESVQPERSFERSFLSSDVLRIVVAQGLIEQDEHHCIVDAHSLRLDFLSEVPANAVHLGSTDRTAVFNGPVMAVRPMQLGAFDSCICVELKRVDGGATEVLHQLKADRQRRSVPSALWGQPLPPGSTTPPAEHELLIPDALVGLTLSAPDAEPSGASPPLDMSALAAEWVEIHGHGRRLDPARRGPQAPAKREEGPISSALLQLLRAVHPHLPSDDALSAWDVSHAPEGLFQAVPSMAAVGAIPRWDKSQ